MNLSNNGVSNKDAKLITPNKANTLNPNAAEFIPSALRSTSGNVKTDDLIRLGFSGPSGKSFQDRFVSSVSNNSDDEVHKFWSDQLPDDITPDFKIVGQDELQTDKHISFAAMSLNDGIEASRFSALPSSQLMGPGHDVYIRGGLDSLNLTGKTGYSGTASAGYGLSPPLRTYLSNKRDNHFMYSDQFMKGGEGRRYHAEPRDFYPKALMSSKNLPWKEYLASQFPAFAAETIADAYYANGRDLKSTIEMLAQLELRHVKSSQNLTLKSLTSPRLSMLDFPASSVAEVHDREDADRRRYERNVSADNLEHTNGKSFLTDKFQRSRAAQTPCWIETGEALAHNYLDSADEAHDFTRLGNLFLEQPRQSYLVDSKAPAMELGMNGNLQSIQRRAVNGKAREIINHQRNPVAAESRGRGQNPLIDLHDLHWGEAIQLLKHELSILRNMGKSARQQLQVIICVGSAEHSRCCRVQTLMPLVEYYLQGEGFQYSQPQPDLLRVLI